MIYTKIHPSHPPIQLTLQHSTAWRNISSSHNVSASINQTVTNITLPVTSLHPLNITNTHNIKITLFLIQFNSIYKIIILINIQYHIILLFQNEYSYFFYVCKGSSRHFGSILTFTVRAKFHLDKKGNRLF